jgi:methylmalonyl-CoA mutase
VARNTPIILDEESHLARVADPAAGSWFLDQLTRDVADAAWGFFQEIEAEGGLVATMKSGWLLERLVAKQDERAARVARRKQPRTGVSEFANVAEKLPASVAAMAIAGGDAWPRHGFDDAFEELRAAADRHAIAHPRPRVFLARSGKPAGYSARETWLVNLVAAAGIEAVLGDPDGDAGNEFVASGAATAILTADDETLAAKGPELAADLGKFGTVWAAGRPTDALAEAGVGNFVHIGIDVVDALGELLAEQGVER